MVDTVVKVNNSNNLSKGKRDREKTKSENMEVLRKKGNNEDERIVPFILGELKRALTKTWMTLPGKDEICYIILEHLSAEGLNNLFSM